MVYELEHNSRTIGCDDVVIGDKVKTLYSSFCKGEIVITDIRTAEMTKVVENTFRDINIAYANELAQICHSDGLDVYEIIRLANKHPRVNILTPGPGVGGHCISVDPWFLVGDYPDQSNLIKMARTINDSMPDYVLNRISEVMISNNITDITKVGLYGLTYKEDVDDVRESPTLQLLESMKRHLASGIKVYDPMVKRELVDNQFHDLDLFLDSVDLVVIMVGHSEIRDNLSLLDSKIVLDTRHISTTHQFHSL
jgi:UDP-N-acetyl-D-mannosaminuronic acid dehydrogenase